MPRIRHLALWLFFCVVCTSNLYAQIPEENDLLKQGEALNDAGYYDSAVQVLLRAKSISAQGEERLIDVFYALGESYLNLGLCDSADYYIRLGLDKSTESSIDQANGFHKLAKAEGGCAGKWGEAAQILKKSIAIKQSHFGAESVQVSKDYTLMGYLYHFHGDYDSALYFLEKALVIREDNPDIDSVELSVTYYYLGNVFERKGQLKKALSFNQKALKIREKKLRPNHPSTSNCLNNVGNNYKAMGNYDRALDYYLRGLEIRKQTLGPDHVNVGASYYSIGTLYGNLFNYRRAIHFIEQGNVIVKKRFGEQLPVLHTYYAYLGRLYAKAGNEKKAKELLDRSQMLAEKHLNANHPYLAIVYNIVGQYYADRNLLERQKEYHQKALAIYQSDNAATIAEADVLMRLGEANAKLNMFQQADIYYRDALKIYSDKLGSKNPKVATLYQLVGDLKKAQGETEEALDYYRSSLEAISLKKVNYNDIDIQFFTHKQVALNSLNRIASTYSEMGDDELTISIRYYEKAIDLIDLIASEFQLEESRNQLSKDTRAVFDGVVAAAYQLYENRNDAEYKHLLFEVIEKSKSPVLKARIYENEAKRFAGVPDSLVTREQDIRVEVAYYREQLRDAIAMGEQEKMDLFQQEVFDAQSTYEAFKLKLREQYPKYYDYWYTNETLTAEDLQGSLAEDEMLITYYWGKNSIFITGISQQTINLEKIPITEYLTNSIEDYHRSLTDNVFIVESSVEADSLLVTSAYYLYSKLVKPVIPKSEIPDKLTIIPDGPLSRLSFGTLLTESAEPIDVQYEQLTYLLSNYDISYGYNAALTYRSSDGNTGLRFGGFAPSYSQMLYEDIDSSKHPMTYELVRNGKLPLPGAIAEVREIQQLIGGKIWVNEEASESVFKKNANQYSILHLAMHSLLNHQEPAYSELLFNAENDTLNDGYLTIDEIYNLDIEATMVVLSACSSGGGSMQVGEGPISFTRAFSYAGCPSVIMSMWKLPDAATSKIMVEFYKRIKAGESKDQALRNAQLSYLSEAEDPLYRHPFFWGSFVAMGDTEPINDETERYWMWILLALLLVGLVFGFQRRFV
ncbi:Tetratricopeptide repeat-containing protein [Ekhidna lutea]|uniref:Tetratricopeptide repeat-containing protein n=1 Tax=Ekhidna lutea TaxID=447679 RepID=A0A239LPZ6_EKHLU|nr:CHAT domain-containing protein [Ekhidna lutea]SNT31714.1 Tetratricopeptide repeat-containing protein [Ekhidna lutea]